MSYVYIDKAVETKNYRWVTSDATIARSMIVVE